MIARAALPFLASAIVAVTLSGCGRDTLSAQMLRTRARALCTAAVRRSDGIAMPDSTSGGAPFLAQGITIFRSELEALTKLAPPRALASAYRTALSDSAQQLDALIATEHNLKTGNDPDPVDAIKQLDLELTSINARDRAAWQALGVPACANLLRVGAARAVLGG